MWEIFNTQDKFGNSLICTENGYLTLSLGGGVEIRGIGRLYNKDSIIIYYKKFNSKKHILRKNNSFGVAWFILNNLSDEDELYFVNERGKEYRIKVGEALKKGSFLWFKEQGMERQFFIPLDDFFNPRKRVRLHSKKD